ncbi:MAG: hypothetical protein HYY06_24480 [Deltaproteobacteria bacterium]|nr:hypothetical protein [Deltaproteobacteria bacterium]
MERPTIGRSRFSELMVLAALAGAWGCSSNESRTSEGTEGTEGEATSHEGHERAKSGEGEAAPPPEPTKNVDPPPAANGTGTIHGKVAFTGTRPTPTPLERDQDPFCGRTPMNDEQVVVNDNATLRNAIVHLTRGVSGNYPPPPAHVGVEQHDCMYRPRAQAMVAGQTLEVKNGDQTLHNVHTYQGTETLFNRAQIAGAPAIEREITDYEGIISLKCDVHGWMAGWIMVLNHPFFSTTGEDGTFTIENVPVGTYTIESWHEKLGRKTAEVTVTRDGTAEVDLSYAGTESGT